MKKNYTNEDIKSFKKQFLKKILLRRLITADLEFKNIITHEYFMENDYISNLKEIPDSIVDTNLNILRTYFADDESFNIFKNVVNVKKELLNSGKLFYKYNKCGTELPDSVDSVACDLCGPGTTCLKNVVPITT